MRIIAFAFALLMLLSIPVFAEQNDVPYMSDPSAVNNDGVVDIPQPPYPPPDLNDDGVVDVRDIVILMQHVLGIRIITCEDKLQRADVNNDGVVDIRDVVIIMQWGIQPL